MKGRITLNSSIWQRYSHVVLIYLFTVLIIVVAAILDEDFLSIRNLKNLVLSSLPLIIAAFGQMMILLTAGIDLSIGSTISFCNVVAIATMQPSEPLGFLLPVIISLVVGSLCGLINGILVTKGRLTPVIATIATMSIYGGLALLVRPVPGGRGHRLFSKLLLGKLGIPIPTILLILMLIFMFLLTTNTSFGRKMRAVGGNINAAYSTGIAVNKVLLITYTLGGLMAGFSALFLTAQMSCGDATVGSQYTINTITVAVVGGTFLSGAVGSAFGIVAGAFIIMILNNILNLVGISSFYQYVFQGLILITALAISHIESIKE